jgi:hypothetical protein
MWEAKAKGLYTNNLITKADLSGKDYLIAKHGTSFHTNVQTAYDVGIPCILFYENNPELLVDNGLNVNNWPDNQNEDLQNVINDVMVGGVNGVKRAIHGIMIDCSKTISSTGKTFTVQWLTQTGQNLINKAWKYLKLPVYLYMNMSPVYTYKNSLNDIETLYSYIAANQGISTVDWATITSTGYPIDSEKPVLPYDDGQPWIFWFYHVNSAVNIDVLHYHDKATLYSSLNYSPSSSTGNTGDTGDTGSTVDSSLVLAELVKQTALLQQILAYMKSAG